MEINNKHIPDSSKSGKSELPKFLAKYESSDFSIQQRARFLYYLCISIVVSLVFMTIYTSYIQLINPIYTGLYLPVILPELAIILIVLACLFLIIKGFSELATHLLLISSITTLWVVMWFDKGDAIARLDSIVFILCILSMLPLLIIKYKSSIILYVLSNIAMLYVFMYVNYNELELTKASAIDYIADISISLIVISIIGYCIYIINKQSTDRAIRDIKERLLAEEKFKESDEGYRYMFENNPQPMWIYDLESLSILEVNNAATKHYGYSKEEFLSFTLKNICPKEDIPILLEEVKQIDSFYSSKGISRHLKKNGELIYADIAAHTITYKNRKARHIMINDITDQIQTEMALAESEKKFREMTNMLPQTVFESDTNGRITYINKNGYELFGLTTNDLLEGVNIFSLISENDRSKASTNFSHTIKGETVEGNQYIAINKNGIKFPIQVFSRAFEENQITVGLRGIAFDISERIKAEEELKQSRDQFQSLVSNIPGITYRCLYDKDWTMLYMSSEIDKISGYKSENFIHNKVRSFGSIILPDDSQIVLKAVETAINESRSWEIEYRIRHKDGNIRWAYEKGRAVRNREGIIEYLDGFILDITERKKVDELLRESELRYKTLIETSQDGISLMDLTGKMLFINKRKVEMAKASSEDDLLGKNAFDLLTESSRIAIKEIMPKLFQKGYINNLEAEVMCLDGTTFNAEFNVTVLKDKNGNPLYLMDTMRDITERKRIQEKLRESEEKYRTLMENMNEAVMMVDNDDRVQFINKKFTEIVGYTPDEIVGSIGYEKLLNPKDHDHIKRVNQERTEKITGQYELTFIAKDGRKIDFLVSGAPIIDLEGKTQGSIGAMIDITERKKAEEKLKESEKKFRDLSELLPQTVWESDINGNITYANKHGIEAMGRTKDDITNGLNLLSTIIPEDRERAITNIQKRVLGHPISINKEYTSLRKDGTTYPSQVFLSVITENEKPIGLRGITIDLTDIKKAEKELKESEEKYRTLMESMNEVVIMADNEHKVLYVNKKFTEKLGYTSEEIIGKIGYKILHDPEDLKVVENANTERLEKIQSSYELTFKAKDGRKFDFLVSGAPVENNKGETIGSIGAMMDITEKKIIEKELEQYRNKLEILVKERTEELEASNEELTATNEELYLQRKELETALINLNDTQNKLIQSEKMASLGVLAAGVAHEINNPLNFIYGGIVGLENYFDENLKEHLNEVSPLIEGIHVGVKRAADIVLSLNHYSRKDDLPSTVCNVHSIIDNCLVMLNNQLKNQVDVIKEYTSQPYSIVCNEGRLHQVFLNIISNSIQAIEDKGTITIFTKIEKNRIFISISDTGCGIGVDILPKITDPFFTTKDPGKGTGLGLSITYNILKEYNGTLDFESKEGVGTKAIITLPLNND